MQNSFPSGSVITVQVRPYSWCVACSVAPSPRTRATSAIRSAAWKSRCSRFLPVFPSGTLRNSRRTGSVAEVRIATSGVDSASCRPVTAAQKVASRPGSLASNVMLVSSMVIVLPHVRAPHRQASLVVLHAPWHVPPCSAAGRAERLYSGPDLAGPHAAPDGRRLPPAVRACAGYAITSEGYHHWRRETHDGRGVRPLPRARHAICRRAAPAHPG